MFDMSWFIKDYIVILWEFFWTFYFLQPHVSIWGRKWGKNVFLENQNHGAWGLAASGIQKSDNLQYNTLVRWFSGTKDSSSKCLKFQVLFFFMIFCKNCFNSFSYFFQFTKIKIKSFGCPKSTRNYQKNIAWNIRWLVNQN